MVSGTRGARPNCVKASRGCRDLRMMLPAGAAAAGRVVPVPEAGRLVAARLPPLPPAAAAGSDRGSGCCTGCPSRCRRRCPSRSGRPRAVARVRVPGRGEPPEEGRAVPTHRRRREVAAEAVAGHRHVVVPDRRGQRAAEAGAEPFEVVIGRCGYPTQTAVVSCGLKPTK